MTREQAKLAVNKIAARADRKPVKLYLNGGAVLSGRVEYDDDSPSSLSIMAAPMSAPSSPMKPDHHGREPPMIINLDGLSRCR